MSDRYTTRHHNGLDRLEGSWASSFAGANLIPGKLGWKIRHPQSAFL
jgi:hypothetical protein